MQYHVTLGGIGFLVDPAAYEVRALDPVIGPIPEARPLTPDPRFERVQRQGQFTRGLLADGRFESWRSGSGVIADESAGGALSLGPDLVDCGAGPLFGAGVRAFGRFDGRLYAGEDAAPGRVWSSANGQAWTLAFTTGKPGVRALAAFRGGLYVGNAGDGAVQRWDGTALGVAWTNGAASTTGTEALCPAWLDGVPRLYLGISATDGGWLQSFDGTARGTVAFFDEPRVTALTVLDGRLYVATASAAAVAEASGALYAVEGEPASVSQRAAFGDGYAAGMMPLEHRLALAWPDGSLRTWNPPTGGLAAEPRIPARLATADRAPRALLEHGGSTLWLSHRDPASGAFGLLRYTPGRDAWSLAAVATAGLGLGAEPLALASFGGALLLGVRRAAGGGADAWLGRADLVGAGPAGAVELGPFDLDAPDVDAVYRAVLLRTDPLPAGALVRVDVRVAASAAWQAAGVFDTAGESEATLLLPPGLVGRGLQVRLRFERGPGATDAPRVREVAARGVLAPTLRRAWRFPILLEGDATRPLLRLDNSPEPRTARQMAAELWGLRAQPGPLPFVDLEGASRSIWLRSLQEVPQRTAAPRFDQPWTLAHVELVEA